MKEEYYSQVKQDEFLHKKIFKNFKHGTFLDLGAFDGITFSNTYFFEKNLGWRGFCFEPIPKYYRLLEKNRKCKSYNNCIGDKNEIIRFSFVPSNPMLSGITKNLHEDDINRIKKDKIKPIEIKSRVVAIRDFLEKNKIKEIHLLSLDIEGNEEKVLRAINYKKIFIHSICLEDNYNEKKMDKFLIKRGFVLLKHCGFDKIFVNKKSRFYPKNSRILRLNASFVNVAYNRSLQRFFRNGLGGFPKIKKIIKRSVGT